MGMRINTNIEALNAQRNLGLNALAFGKSVEKLSSGLRINRAADDAAGLSISEKLKAQINGLNQAVRNSQDGISMIQTAEGALNEVEAMLQRMRELAVQAANDTLSSTDAASIKTELTQLQQEVNSTSSRTKFNGKGLLNGSLSTAVDTATSDIIMGTSLANSAVGATASAITALDVSGASAATTYTLDVDGVALTAAIMDGATVLQTISIADVAAAGSETLNFNQVGISFTISNGDAANALSTADLETDLDTLTIVTDSATSAANVQIGAGATDTLSLSFGKIDLSGSVGDSGGMDALATALTDYSTTQNSTNAQALITAVDGAIDKVNGQRSTFGAWQNRLEHTINNLGVATENLSASASRIRDVDLASEMVNFTKTQILQQAGTSILAQANQAPQSILQLLR